jgi:O-antigen/teichoic acid export membrane protein
VFLLIGLARIVEMATGLNNYMVYYSQYYRYSLLSLGVLAVANVCLNIWLIPRLGISGAALATLLSIAAYNAISLGLVWLKFGLFPFTVQTLKALGAAPAAYLLAGLIPTTGYPLADLILHSGAYALMFVAAVLYFRVSEDLSHLFQMGVRKVRGWRG